MKIVPSGLLLSSRIVAVATMLLAGLASAHAQTFKVLHQWQGVREGYQPNAPIEGSDGRVYGTTQDGGPDAKGIIFALNPDGSEFTVLRYLSGSDGGSPRSGLIEGTDGRLYGTTSEGGSHGYGTLFALNLDGSGFVVLRHLDMSTDGASPYARLFEGTDGRLYGTTYSGGSYGAGTLFAMHPDGSGFVVLRHFSGSTDGSSPRAGLNEGTDGRLYGTNSSGGAYGGGTLFALNLDGSGFTVLRDLNAATDGSFPFGGLTEATGGRLYGTASEGGINGDGTLFALNPDGSDFTVLRHFRYSFGLPFDPDGGRPWAGVTEGVDGRLYGTTSHGGEEDCGTLFAVNSDGSGFTVLHPFSFHSGHNPHTDLTEGAGGRLYGATSAEAEGWGGGLHPPPGVLFALNPDGYSYMLHKLHNPADGANPYAGLTQGSDGRLYGSTTEGGNGDAATLFALNPDGSDFTTLFNFTGAYMGGVPRGALTEGTDGRLYGTAGDLIFALNRDGSEFVVLHRLNPYTDGVESLGGLIEGSDGRLYGTTLHGGTNGFGTLFAINRDGSSFTVLRYLNIYTVGAGPRAGLMEGTDGRLYGAIVSGGLNFNGTVIALNRDGSGLTVLRHLNESTDGAFPFAGLIQGADGRLYGTTLKGGSYGSGTLFALNPDGSGFTVLRHLNGPLDGGAPFAGLIQATEGRLYGTASEGGTHGYGTLFALNPDGSDFAVLHHLDGSTDGAAPYGGLTEGANGRLYGTASCGGIDGLGTIFVLSFVPEITSPLTTTGQFKQPFNYTITATNDPDDFDALGLPEGLRVDNVTGLISGVPREKGGFAVTIAASNAYGTGVADLSLTIALAPPTIMRQPQDVTAIANKNVTFSVTAKSTSKLHYQWLKGDQPIQGATGHKLMLQKITLDDAGSYRVSVTNSAGSVQSDSATLTVLPAKGANGGVVGKAGAGARR